MFYKDNKKDTRGRGGGEIDILWVGESIVENPMTVFVFFINELLASQRSGKHTFNIKHSRAAIKNRCQSGVRFSESRGSFWCAVGFVLAPVTSWSFFLFFFVKPTRLFGV